MAQLLSNEDEVLEAYDPSIAASRRFRYVHIRRQIPMELISKYCFLDIPLLFSSIWHFVRWLLSRILFVHG